ncbi:MAG: hypothetical protein SFU99_23710 [Saprospiraceae bacterium]|nr:hypothetical protein [Saprospiraceae bacterium]
MITTSNFKQELRRLLAADEPEKVIQQLLEHTEAIGALQLHNELVLQSGRYAQYERDQRLGTEDYDDLIRTRIKISQALLGIIDQLSEENAKAGKVKRLRGISEKALKNHVLWILLIEKILVVGFVFFLWETGTFTVEQFTNTIGLLIPLFATYLTVMLKDAAKHRHVEVALDQKLLVKRNYQWMTYFLLLLYFWVIVGILNLRGPGILNQSQFTTLLATVESGLGVYIGTIVLALFKKEEV